MSRPASITWPSACAAAAAVLALALAALAAAPASAPPPPAAAAPAPAAPDSAPPPPKDDNLVWNDEFDGTELDASKWGYHYPGKRRDGVTVKEAATLDGRGHLLITTSKVGQEYHTSMIETRGKFERVYGYFECRVKLQKQPGHWSAFWLMPRNMGKAVGDTQASGTEIDIFEYLPIKPDKAQHTLHWDGYGKDHKSQGHVADAPGFGDGWHVAGLEWTAQGYAFFIDGKETWRTDKAVSGAPQYIILSLEVGKWAGNIADAKLPDSVIFDYVRVYKARPK
jgi:beta-glucanase (GH16 family)